MNLIDELQWRGMVHTIMPGTNELLQRETVNGYIGFDPTADSLHIGSLVPILLLMHLQNAGHKPIALVGGATGMVGDPSGKSDERNLLDEATLNHNVACIKAQLAQFLNFDGTAANAAELVNNYDWFKNFSFLNFIRDVGKHITVNYMMAKESVKKRIDGDTGMSFTEFSYQLVQGYDFYELYTTKNCKLQMGGSDQWGNILTGTELIRRKTGGEAYAFTCPLITKADGGKFGKSEKGNIWLDANKTSPFDFYQFWVRCDVEDAEKWIKIFTFLPKETIETLIITNAEKPEAKLLQKKLAEEVTKLVHGQAALDAALATTQQLYSTTQQPIDTLTAEALEALEGIVKVTITKADYAIPIDVVSFVAQHGIFESKGDAKKMIQNGGLAINRKKVTTATNNINMEQLLHHKYLLIQKGKKQHYLIIVT